MTKYLVSDDVLTDVADAIRTKKGTQASILVSDFDTEIASISGGSSHDWSAIGYSGEPQAIQDGYDYAVGIKNNWESATSLRNKFKNDNDLIFMPLVDTSIATDIRSIFSSCVCLISVPTLNTSNVTNMGSAFSTCYSLKKIPVLNTSKVTNFDSMFANCGTLSDTSLDNILQMCINAISYSGVKTLARLGINSTYYSVSRIEALPHYQDFLDAGWTIGY